MIKNSHSFFGELTSPLCIQLVFEELVYDYRSLSLSKLTTKTYTLAIALGCGIPRGNGRICMTLIHKG